MASDQELPGQFSMSIDGESIPFTMQAEVGYMTLDEAIASGLFDLPDEPGMVRIPISMNVLIPNHLLFPSEPPENQYDPDELYDMAEDESRVPPWHAAAFVTGAFGATIGPAADAEKAAFREMLKVIHGGRGQGVPTLPVAEPIETTDVGLPRIVVDGASFGDAAGKQAAAAVARYDAVAQAPGDAGRGGSAGSLSLLGQAGHALHEALPTARHVQDAAGMATGAFGVAVGAAATAVGGAMMIGGVVTSPEGVGVPVVAGGALLAREGIMTTRLGHTLYRQSLDDLEAPSMPPLVAPTSPPPLIHPKVAEPLGGITPAKPMPTNTAGETPTVNLGPLIFLPPDLQIPIAIESRNKGFDDYPGLRTNGRRVEKNAELSDKDVTSNLPRGAWQAAHNIPVQVIKDNLGVFGPASKVKDGFATDEPGNMSALPETADAQKTLASKKIIRPTHNGPHGKYSQEVQEAVDEIKDELREEGLTPGMDGYSKRANELIRQLETKLRDALPTRSSVN